MTNALWNVQRVVHEAQWRYLHDAEFHARVRVAQALTNLPVKGLIVAMHLATLPVEVITARRMEAP